MTEECEPTGSHPSSPAVPTRNVALRQSVDYPSAAGLKQGFSHGRWAISSTAAWTSQSAPFSGTAAVSSADLPGRPAHPSQRASTLPSWRARGHRRSSGARANLGGMVDTRGAVLLVALVPTVEVDARPAAALLEVSVVPDVEHWNERLHAL